ILRNGAAEKTFRMLAELGLLEPISHELHRGATEPLWKSLAAIDAYRHGFQSAPDTLTNSVLMGTLLTPLGISLYPQRQKLAEGEKEPRHPPLPKLGELPLARRDVEKLRQLIQMQRRLLDIHAHPRAQQGLLHRSTFREALTWLEIHGHAPDV